VKRIYGVKVCLRFARGAWGCQRMTKQGYTRVFFWMQKLGCGTGCTDLKDEQSRAEVVRFERFSPWSTVCGCSVFTCNNKASQLGINETIDIRC